MINWFRICIHIKLMTKYRTPMRCSAVDAEPRFDGVDCSPPSAELSVARRGVVGWELTAFGGVGVRLSITSLRDEEVAYVT